MMKRAISTPRRAMAAGLAAGLLALGALAALGTAGWAAHGERLWLAMADGAWMTCF